MSGQAQIKRAAPGTPLIDRLWMRSTRSESGCWVWQGRLDQGGYGSYWTQRGASSRVHRIAYELLVGPIPEGLHLDHLCRVRACWNPAHLEPVTPLENTRRGLYALAAINARKTHCDAGHPFTGRNVINRMRRGRPARECRACRILRHRESRRRAAIRRELERAAA